MPAEFIKWSFLAAFLPSAFLSASYKFPKAVKLALVFKQVLILTIAT
jgi:hypothetical protein